MDPIISIYITTMDIITNIILYYFPSIWLLVHIIETIQPPRYEDWLIPPSLAKKKTKEENMSGFTRKTTMSSF